MKVSYNWLQIYFKDPLPTPEKLGELFTFRFAEVESVEQVGADSILDVKVLPDRAHYALCHKGIAYEVAAITGMTAQYPVYAPVIVSDAVPAIRVDEPTLCTRYTARYIENVSVGESPAWLKERLTAIGQRPINIIVDAANYAMFDIGQPLHAFDADKVVGTIVVRRAQTGERITTLDNKEVTLTPEILVIADDQGPLAIAGIKGGTRAQVDASTKRLILESAHFDSAYIRTASTALGIRTDASKRYENEITSGWASAGSDRCAALIAELIPAVQIGALADTTPEASILRTITLSSAVVSGMLGTAISESEILAILACLDIKAESENGMLTLTIPSERLDLVSAADIAEEVGRIYGYENVPPIAPPKLSHAIVPEKSRYYEEKIRDILIKNGFSEIFTYSFTNSGFHEIEKSLASDKNFLRANLLVNMNETLARNAHNTDLLGLDDVILFEIGKVFDHMGEKLSLSLGARKIKKEKGVTGESLLALVHGTLESELKVKLEYITQYSTIDFAWEINLDPVIAALPEPTTWNIEGYKQENVTYKKISPYPFTSRDIALFVPVETSQTDVASVITTAAGELAVRVRLFDVFTKTFPDGTQKTSYAFRIVFQSDERTLTDEDANTAMARVQAAVSARGWEVR